MPSSNINQPYVPQLFVPPSNVPSHNAPPTYMPPTNVPPHNVSSSFFPPSYVPLCNAPPSNAPPSNVPPSNVPSFNFNFPSSNVPPSMSVPPNSSRPLWDQAFQNTFPSVTLPTSANAFSAAPSPSATAPPDYGNHWHSGMSPHPYEIVTLPSNVQKCYGCGTVFSEKSRSAPYNLCIKHVDKRVIGKNANGHLIYSGDFTNTYYHPSISHIKRKNPLFTGLVYVRADLYTSLDAPSRQQLNSFEFNVILK